jgi:endonuclease III
MADAQSPSESDRLFRDILKTFEKQADFAPAPSPVEELVLEALRDKAGEAEALAALGRIRASFLDLNEMRVARTTELARVLDPMPEAESAAARIQKSLNRLFEREGGMSLTCLEELKPSEARKALQSIDKGISRNTAGRILFATCPGATMPASAEALKAARRHGLLGRTAGKAQLQKAMLQALEPEEAARLLFHIEADGDTRPRKRGKTKSATGDRKKKSGGASRKKKTSRKR